MQPLIRTEWTVATKPPTIVRTDFQNPTGCACRMRRRDQAFLKRGHQHLRHLARAAVVNVIYPCRSGNSMRTSLGERAPIWHEARHQ